MRRLTEHYAEQNEQAARVIVNNPTKYPGVLQEWARMVLVKAAPADAECGPLFGGKAA